METNLIMIMFIKGVTISQNLGRQQERSLLVLN
jgi:hypothetical protein